MLLTSKSLFHRSVMATLPSSSFFKSHPFNASNSNANYRFQIFEHLAKTGTIVRDYYLSERKSTLHGLGSVHIKTTNYGLNEIGSLEGETFPLGGHDGVVSVLEDSARKEAVWELTSKDVETVRDRTKVTSPGFSFSAAGMLIPYHLGVAQLLIEKGYIKETTPVAGSSAGAIVSVAIASGISMESALKATKKVVEDCRLNGTALRVGAVLRDFLVKFLPDDIHIRSNGRVHVGITQLSWRPRRLLVNHFDSKEDLIDAVFTSSFIPGYLAARPATIFHNQYCVDGALTFLMPPTPASKTVYVCAFPASRMKLKNVEISPDCSQNNQATPKQYLKWALEPAEDKVIDKFFELGHQDASVWAQQNPVETVVHDEEIGGSN